MNILTFQQQRVPDALYERKTIYTHIMEVIC